MILLVMGVSGSGKTTVGELLAARLGVEFLDADSLHSPANVAKMAAGTPLVDTDRWPWLRSVADWIAVRRASGGSAVVGCSALKRAYRDILRDGHDDLTIVYLTGSRELLASRLGHRVGHFFPAQLLDAQLADLEEPGPDERPIVESIDRAPEQIVADVQAQIT